MRLYTQPLRQQRMTGLIADAGTVWTWFRYVTATGGTAYAGIGDTPAYTTGYLTGIWAQAGQREQDNPGGQFVVGQETLFCKEKVGTADRLSYSGAQYEVIAEPQPAQLYETMYYKTVIKRG
jgi:hypothetical protein